MINKPPPFKGLNIRIPIIIPIKGRGFINQGSGLPAYVDLSFKGLGHPCKSLLKCSRIPVVKLLKKRVHDSVASPSWLMYYVGSCGGSWVVVATCNL